MFYEIKVINLSSIRILKYSRTYIYLTYIKSYKYFSFYIITADIEASYVFVDDTLYNFTDALSAIDFCFKIIHSLQANYPLESEPIWVFLQKQVYNITTIYDKNFQSLNTLVNAIK